MAPAQISTRAMAVRPPHYTVDMSVASRLSGMKFIGSSRGRIQRLSFYKSNSTHAQRRCFNQHKLSREPHFSNRRQTTSLGKNNHQLTTLEHRSNRIGNRKRKKKPLLQSSDKTLTTKDRLRLSSRPQPNSRWNKDNVLEESMMIQSPEELAKRLHSGLDIARAAMRETYSSFRNPNVISAGKNHFLPARQAPSSISKGTKPTHPKGLVMDANWWFWNLLLAASPSVAIALYCEFIVKPEMRILNEEKEKQESSRGERETNSSSDDGIGEVEKTSTSVKNMSPMRKRQEERKQEQKHVDDATSRNWHSPLSRSSSDLNEMLSSYVRLLAFWFAEPQTPSLEENLGHDGKIGEGERRGAKIGRGEHEEEHKIGKTEMEIQQQKLRKLQSQLRILKDEVDRQQQKCSEAIASNGHNGSDKTAKESAVHESLLSPKSKTTKIHSETGEPIRRKWSFPFFSWWQRRSRPQQSSDEYNCQVNSDGNDVSNKKTELKHEKEKDEKVDEKAKKPQ